MLHNKIMMMLMTMMIKIMIIKTRNILSNDSDFSNFDWGSKKIFNIFKTCLYLFPATFPRNTPPYFLINNKSGCYKWCKHFSSFNATSILHSILWQLPTFSLTNRLCNIYLCHKLKKQLGKKDTHTVRVIQAFQFVVVVRIFANLIRHDCN